MRRTIVLSAISITLLGSATLSAQAQQPPPAPPAVISFFVAENPNQTGNLGGLAGADQMCQTQAQALGGQNAARECAGSHRPRALVQRQGCVGRQQRRRSAW